MANSLNYKIGIDNIYRYEHELLEYAISKMTQISGLRLIKTIKCVVPTCTASPF